MPMAIPSTMIKSKIDKRHQCCLRNRTPENIKKKLISYLMQSINSTYRNNLEPLENDNYQHICFIIRNIISLLQQDWDIYTTEYSLAMFANLDAEMKAKHVISVRL